MASVSVIVPTYERPDLLRAALDSALAQTYDDFVILVGDNSESDVCEQLVADIADPRIRYHRNRPGLGPQGNWLDLVARADTPLVASLHDDDVWEPEFLEATVPAMLADDSIAMHFTDFWMIDDSGHGAMMEEDLSGAIWRPVELEADLGPGAAIELRGVTAAVAVLGNRAPHSLEHRGVRAACRLDRTTHGRPTNSSTVRAASIDLTVLPRQHSRPIFFIAT